MIITAADLILAMQDEAMRTYDILIQMYDDKDVDPARFVLKREAARYQHNACKMATATFKELLDEDQKEPDK